MTASVANESSQKIRFKRIGERELTGRLLTLARIVPERQGMHTAGNAAEENFWCGFQRGLVA